MTPTNDAEKAFKNYADKFCSIGYGPTEDYKIIAAALARSAKVDGLLDALKEISTKGSWRYFEGQLINRAEEALKHFNWEDKSK